MAFWTYLEKKLVTKYSRNLTMQFIGHFVTNCLPKCVENTIFWKQLKTLTNFMVFGRILDGHMYVFNTSVIIFWKNLNLVNFSQKFRWLWICHFFLCLCIDSTGSKPMWYKWFMSTIIHACSDIFWPKQNLYINRSDVIF